MSWEVYIIANVSMESKHTILSLRLYVHHPINCGFIKKEPIRFQVSKKITDSVERDYF